MELGLPTLQLRRLTSPNPPSIANTVTVGPRTSVKDRATHHLFICPVISYRKDSFSATRHIVQVEQHCHIPADRTEQLSGDTAGAGGAAVCTPLLQDSTRHAVDVIFFPKATENCTKAALTDMRSRREHFRWQPAWCGCRRSRGRRGRCPCGHGSGPPGHSAPPAGAHCAPQSLGAGESGALPWGDSTAGKGKTSPPGQPLLPAPNASREREPPSPKDRRDGWAAASMPRDNQVPYRSVRPSASAQKLLLKVNKKNKNEGRISSRTALMKTLLAQKDPSCGCPWSLHVPSQRFSGLLHTSYRPRGQLAKHRAPAESERETSSRDILIT